MMEAEELGPPPIRPKKDLKCYLGSLDFSKPIGKIGPKERYVAWTDELVLNSAFTLDIDFAVPDIVPYHEYQFILRAANFNEHRIINPRQHPYSPPIAWIKIDTLAQVFFLRPPDYEGQLYLIVVHPDVSDYEYQRIVYHALERGFLVPNIGPWKGGSSVLRNYDLIYGAQIHNARNHFLWAEERRLKAEATCEEINTGISVTMNVSEAIGRAVGYADTEAFQETMTKSKMEEISQIREKLVSYKKMIFQICEKSSFYERLLCDIERRLEREKRRMMELEHVLSQLPDQFSGENALALFNMEMAAGIVNNSEMLDCCEVLKVCKQGREKDNKWVQSLKGISTTFGLSMLVYLFVARAGDILFQKTRLRMHQR